MKCEDCFYKRIFDERLKETDKKVKELLKDRSEHDKIMAQSKFVKEEWK